MPPEISSRFGAPGAATEGAAPGPARDDAPPNLLSLLDRPSDQGDRPALTALREGAAEDWSYAELRRMVGRLAAGLLGAGLRPEEPVALIAPNRPEWVVAYFAIVAAGGLAVPIDPLMGDGDLARVLPHSGCRRIFTTSGHVDRLRRLDDGVRRQFILFEGEAEPEGSPDLLPWRRLLADEPAPFADLRPERPASLLYTSGTTGVPKGVPLSHANFLANVDALAAEGLARPDDRVLLPLPLHHVYPFTVGLLTPLAIGATVIMPAGMAGPQILQALRQAGATIMIAVPRLLAAILTGITARAVGGGGIRAALFRMSLGLSRWLYRHFGWRVGRRLFGRLHAELAPDLALLASGGARLDPEMEITLDALGWEVLTGYGLTETAPILTFNPRGRARIGSAGLPVRGVELRIAPADGQPEGSGEVLARGPNVFSGYWDNPEANATAFTPDGWFRTGDLGYLDGDGYLYLVGRVKEMVVLASGKNVLPEDVEKVYLESPYFKEMGILERNGQLVGLIVPDMDALRAKGAGRAEALLRDEVEAVSARLPPYQRLSGYAVTREPLPRTPIGKLRRHLLPEMYTAAAEGRRAPKAEEPSEADKALLRSPLGKAVWDWLQERFPDQTLTLDTSPQLDLGMDSLEWVSLGLEMQARFGVELTEEAIARVVTLRDLLQEVEKAKTVPADEAAEGQGPVPELTPEQARWLRPLSPGLLLLSLLLYGVNWLVMRLLFRLEVRGLERLPRQGSMLFTPNHASYLDPFALSAALPWTLLRRTYWAGAVDVMFTTRTKRLFSRLTHVFPVDPYRAANTSVAYGTVVLGSGKNLVWFPEGRRSQTGELLPFLPGVGVLVQRAEAPVVPVRIDGSFEALPVSRRWPRLHRIRVTFGPPLRREELVRRGEDETSETAGDIARSIQDAVAALADGHRQGDHPSRRWKRREER